MEESRIDEIFSRLEEIDIELDYDPIERGPKFLNQMVASCRNYTTEVQRYMRECQMHRRTLERDLRTREAAYELEFNHIMANDPDIVSMRGLSRADREALTNYKLRAQYERIKELEIALVDAGHVETVIESKLRELREINRDIRLQKRLIEDEIQTGAFWGNDNNSDAVEISTEDIDVSTVFEFPAEEEEESDTETYEDFFYTERLDTKEKEDKVSNPVKDTGVTTESEILQEEDEYADFDFESALRGIS